MRKISKIEDGIGSGERIILRPDKREEKDIYIDQKLYRCFVLITCNEKKNINEKKIENNIN